MGESLVPGASLSHVPAVAQGSPRRKPPSRTLSCRLDGHDPDTPAISELGHGALVRAVVHCKRCGSYISSFEGPLRSVRNAAFASRIHGLRSVPA